MERSKGICIEHYLGHFWNLLIIVITAMEDPIVRFSTLGQQ
jgi:hypothetical protein